jgi:neutral ceramidase
MSRGPVSTILFALATSVIIALVPACGSDAKAAAPFNVGAAKIDITGPFVQESTGYNSPGDEMSGLAMRLYSRAFVIEDPDGRRVVALVTADALHMYQSIKIGVVKKLAADGYGSVFATDNVLVAGTHTHAAPSNISWYPLYNVFNGVPGFDVLNYRIVVDGIAQSIETAYLRRRAAMIRIAVGTLSGAAHNRSLAAYRADLDASQFPSNVDETMTLLRFDGADGSAIGAINWFGVHGTSLGITNRREHGDNKGWAAYQFEKTEGGDFVAAFAQGLFGDVSPNQPVPGDVTRPFLRPHDLDPTLDPLEDPIVHGRRQLQKAQELYAAATGTLPVSLDVRHTYVDYNHIPVGPDYIGDNRMPWDTSVAGASTCIGAVGAGILAGDEDGAPVHLGEEGQIKNTYTMEDGRWVFQPYPVGTLPDVSGVLGPLWPLAERALENSPFNPCQKEKVVLLPVGDVADLPFSNPTTSLVPVILPLQIIRIGSLAVAALPFEPTTMAGRRIRALLARSLGPVGVSDVVVAGMANAYGQYMATREEYAMQNFEGAFTFYGPWQLAATTQQIELLARDMAAGRASSPGPNPPDLSNEPRVQTEISQTGVVNDSGSFGRVLTDALPSYNRTRDVVTVRFQGAHPRTVQQLKADGQLSPYYDPDTYSYLEVQKQAGSGWTTVAADGDPYTAFDWVRTGGPLSSTSEVTVTWLVRDASPGTYRVVYLGLAKRLGPLGPTYQKFVGTSRSFSVQ